MYFALYMPELPCTSDSMLYCMGQFVMIYVYYFYDIRVYTDRQIAWHVHRFNLTRQLQQTQNDCPKIVNYRMHEY